MARTDLLSTRVLLVSAAIGVATGILGGIAGLLSAPVVAGAPILYGLLLGVHVLPGIIAQEVLQRPLVALLAHLLAALVSTAFAPGFALRFLGTALLFGGIQELVVALVRYRSWATWRYFVSAIIIGGIVAVAVFFAADLASLPGWAQITYLALALAGPLAWTAIGVFLGHGLRAAGVGRRTR